MMSIASQWQNMSGIAGEDGALQDQNDIKKNAAWLSPRHGIVRHSVCGKGIVL